MKRLIYAAMLSGVLNSSAENFDGMKSGGFTSLKSELGVFQAKAGQVEINSAHSRSGRQSLRLLGGESRQTELVFPRKEDTGMVMSFWAERWTRAAPFQFHIEARRNGEWSEVFQGEKTIRVGGFYTHVEVVLEAGVDAVRFVSTSPEGSGVMIDDLGIENIQPMMVGKVTTIQPVIPVLINKKNNPVLGLLIETKGRTEPKSVSELELDLSGTTDASSVNAVRVFYSGGENHAGQGELFGEARLSGGRWVCKGSESLVNGENYFWISVEVADSIKMDGVVDAGVLEVRLADGKVLKPDQVSPEGGQRIGYALRQHGDDGSKAFRIPGMATTNKGALIAVYDVRYRSGGDLPGDIDVGLSRSTDGGQSWDPMKIIMDMGDDPRWRYDGVGDPAVLVDKTNGRIWVIGTWSHGNRSWHGSGQGLEPEETGQLMLVHSDDDGLTWSKPLNITKQVKKPDWHFLLQGPGAGITMNDGTIVFAAQYQDGDKHPDGRKLGTPFSTIIYSKDQGETWKVGTGIKSNTTEAQVVELKDGSLMLNCRDNRGGARTVGVTRDMGETWELHPTDRKALNEPVCMASLLRMGDRLIFSNPNTRRGRYNLTIKVSGDEGMTWPEDLQTLYDARHGSGYSCLSPIGDSHVGVLYEGPAEIYFLRLSLDELLKREKAD